MQAYAKLRTDTPELLDLVAQFGGQDLTDDPMAVDGHSSAPVANSGEFLNNKNKIKEITITILIIKITIIIIKSLSAHDELGIALGSLHMHVSSALYLYLHV